MGVWSSYARWPSAIQAAIKKNGGQGIKDGQFEGSYGHVALDYLTGKNGVFQFKDNNTCEHPFSFLEHCSCQTFICEEGLIPS